MAVRLCSATLTDILIFTWKCFACAFCVTVKAVKLCKCANLQCINHNRQILSELNILLAALIIAFLVQTLHISTKSTAQFLSNNCLKNGTQKQKFPIWKSRLSSSYALPSVTVCAQSGRHLQTFALHVSCVDRAFYAAARLPVCKPCSVHLPQKSVQCWTRPLLVSKILQQLSDTVTLTLP